MLKSNKKLLLIRFTSFNYKLSGDIQYTQEMKNET